MSKFLPTSRFKWINPKTFDLNKHSSNSLEGYVLEIDLQYPKELHELHNNNPLALDKTEIKKFLSYYQLKTGDFYNISTDNFKKLLPNSFDEEKYVQLCLRLGLKLKNTLYIRIQ